MVEEGSTAEAVAEVAAAAPGQLISDWRQVVDADDAEGCLWWQIEINKNTGLIRYTLNVNLRTRSSESDDESR